MTFRPAKSDFEWVRPSASVREKSGAVSPMVSSVVMMGPFVAEYMSVRQSRRGRLPCSSHPGGHERAGVRGRVLDEGFGPLGQGVEVGRARGDRQGRGDAGLPALRRREPD